MGATTVATESTPAIPAYTASPPKTKGTNSIDTIFRHLSDEQIEIAARSSYRYLVSSTNGNASEEDRDKHAKAMIFRYLQAEQKVHPNSPSEQWEAAALDKMKKTLAFRVEKNVDDIRLCFDKTHSSSSSSSENEEEKKADDSYEEEKRKERTRIRKGLEDRFQNGASVVRGYTKDGRALFLNFPRTETSWNEEFFIAGNIYTIERALACTERNTDGEKSKIVVMYDYNEYAMKNSPPTQLVKKLLYNLRDHWPERLEHVFVVDAPFIFRAFWAVIKHFIDPITKDLVQFVTGEEMKRKVFSEIVSEEHATPWMLAEGKNAEDADMQKYLRDIPFDYAYGEKFSDPI
mmetsp:Transcript_17542/g.35706  ORF Transcript_17542/g.35706 Transcript_17542/m.35706 type:complete len:347 (+) Transcript_17542:109-1149(+)